MDALKAIIRLICGKPHRRMASLLIVVGAGLLGYDIIIYLAEAFFNIVFPEADSAYETWAIVAGFLCIFSGIGIFIYFENKGAIVPETNQINMEIPVGVSFELAITRLAQRGRLEREFEGFSDSELATLLQSKAELNDMTLEQSARNIRSSLSASFPTYTVSKNRKTLKLVKETS